MNREVRFRAWHKCNKEMIDVGEIDFNLQSIYYNMGNISFDEFEIMQSTGLKDKNGKEIYEGDIVEFLDTGEEGYEYKEGYDFNNIASIVWENGRFELDNIYDNNSAVLEVMNNESHEEFIDELMSDCQIIGNIFENSELLEVVNGQH